MILTDTTVTKKAIALILALKILIKSVHKIRRSFNIGLVERVAKVWDRQRFAHSEPLGYFLHQKKYTA